MRASYSLTWVFPLCIQLWVVCFAWCENGRASGRCFLSIPQRTSRWCKIVRGRELAKKRHFYKMTQPTNRHPFPLLDQPKERTIQYFSADKFHANWSNLYFTVGGNARLQTARDMLQKTATSVFTSYGNYTDLGNSFKEAYLAAASPHKQFKFASKSYKYFTDWSKNDLFKEDDIFAQLRLAGPNPMAIRRVTLEGKIGTNYCQLSNRLNANFDWEYAVTSITKDKDIQESIEESKVYVVEYPALVGIPHMSDILAKYNPGRTMRNNTAQIALFAVDPKRRLRPVAIQNSTSKAGHVFTPKDGRQWTIAKAELHISDIFYGSNIDHLLKTHFKMEPICISMHRHLSKIHPLHQILQYHCRGLIPVNAFGLYSLLHNSRTHRSLFSYGNEGAIKLLHKEYPKMKWYDVDLEWNIQERGMDDREHLPYYPYRDDGRLINRVFRKFASRLINVYYKRDHHVYYDYELQNMIGELSQRRGSKHADKISRVKGLPAMFWTRMQLKRFVRQLLWIIVHHSVFSYSAIDYFQSPLYPSKLYDSQKQNQSLDFVQMLPGPLTTILQLSLSSGVAALHYDSMFDYWKHLKSRKLRFLVKRAYKELLIAQRYIARRNRKRYYKGQLTNPHMMTGWLPSSICT